jgi:flavin-dependent dehydrogenase
VTVGAAGRDFDVIIIGGGPAGSMTGGLLARQGWSVCILEKEEFPRFHIGESMLAQSLGVLARAGALERVERTGFVRKNGAVFLGHDGGRCARFDFGLAEPRSEFPYAYQVDRASFDALLLDWARDAGVVVRSRAEALTVRGREGGETASVGSDGTRLGARFVVDAAGLDSSSARLRGWSREPLVKDRVGLFGHFRLPRPAVEGLADAVSGDILIVEDPTAWAWFIPLRQGVTSVGFVVLAAEYGELAGASQEERFSSMAARFPEVGSRVAGAERLSPIRGARSYGRSARLLSEDGLVLAGDAAGFLDPVFSSGICLALDGAENLAGALGRALADDGSETEVLTAYASRVRRGMDSMGPFVENWYGGLLKRIFYHPRPEPTLKANITSLLAGELWNEGNPLVREGSRYLSGVAALLPA